MKIAFYGNICNNFYTLAKVLREEAGLDAHLYLHSRCDIQNRPESDDPHLTNNYPHWIHLSSQWYPINFLKNGDRSFIKELNRYDLVFLSDDGPVLAPFIRGKKIFYVTGGDLTRYPFPSKWKSNFRTIKDRLIWEYIGFMQRRGIRACDRIISQPFFPFVNALKAINVRQERISTCYFPFLIDEEVIRNQPESKRSISEENRVALQKFQFIVFHPSRLVIKKDSHLVETGQWKGNDNLIRGFAHFVKKYNANDACLAIVDKEPYQKPMAEKVIEECKISNNIVWLKPSTPQGFRRNELMQYYSLSDIVADEFATGWFGLVVLEGLACEKPTFCYVNEMVMKQLYPWHPIQSFIEEEEISNGLAKFYLDEGLKKKTGIESRKWIMEFHSKKNGARNYLNNFKKEFPELFKDDDEVEKPV